MSNRLKSFRLATLVLSLTVPLLPNFVRAGLPRPSLLAASAQTPTEKPKTETDRLFQQGVQQYRLGQYSQALQTYQRVLEMRRQQDDKAGIGQTLNNIGEVYLGVEEDDKALEVLQQALAIRQELKDRAGEGETLGNLGLIYFRKEQYDKALETLQQALAIHREVKDRVGEAKTLSRIGSVYNYGFQQYAKGLEILQQALAIQEQVGDKFQAGKTLSRIAAAYSGLDDYPRALSWAQKALSLHQEVKNRADEGITLMQIGGIYNIQNKSDLSLQLLQQALPIIRECGIRPTEHPILQLMAIAYDSQNKKERSLELYQQALTFARANQLRSEELDSLSLLSDSYLNRAMDYDVRGLNYQAKPDYSRVVELSQEALTLAIELNKPEAEANALINQGNAYRFFGDYQKAEAVLQQGVKIAREIHALPTESAALSGLVQIYTENKVDIHKAVEIRLRQVEIAREQVDKASEASALSSLGSHYNVLGEYQKAVEAYQQALNATRKIEINKLSPTLQKEALKFEYYALAGLSYVYPNLEEYDKALNFAQQALKKAQTLSMPEVEAQALLRLASIYTIYFKNFPKATELSQQALTIARQIEEPQIEAEALQELSNIYNKQGNHAQALEFANQILAIAKRLENPDLEQNALDVLWNIYNNQGNYQKALELAKQRLALLQKAKLGLWKPDALTSLSQSYLSVGDTTKAEETVKQALNLAREARNPSSETLALFYLTDVYKAQGKYEQGIETAQNALEISRKINDFMKQVTATVGLSEMYEALGEYQKVIALAQPGLTKAKKVGDRAQEAQLIINLGNAYRLIGDYTKVKQFIDQGLKIALELKNPRLESIALNNLGYFYSSLNDYQKALDFTQQSLKIAQQIKSPPLLLSPFFNLGDIYSGLGNYKKGGEFYQQALTTAQQLKNRQSEGIALFALGYTYFAQGEAQKTVELSQQALTIFREIKVPQLEAFATRMASIGYGELGNDAKTMEAAQTFLAFAKKNQNSLWEKSALSLLGSLHQKFGRKEQAITAYQQALAIKTDNQVTGADAGIYAGLARIYRDLNQPLAAISYYKQSINKIEEFRRGIQGLPPELQSSYLQATVDFDRVKVSDIYRQLADLLAAQGRTTEAAQVIELLKVQEIKEFTRGNTQKPEIPLSPGEQEITKTGQYLIAFGQRVFECEQQKCPQLQELKNQRDNLNREAAKKLKGIENTYDGKDPNLIYSGNFLTSAEIIVKEPSTVFIFPLVLDGKIRIFWASRGVVINAVEIKGVTRSQLDDTVSKFRDLLQNPTSNITEVKATSKQLYDWLIKPIEAELRNNKIKNLVFALDSSTRYIPMSALFDGEKYLVENYNVSTVISASFTNQGEKLPAETQNIPVLALGLSKAIANFNALPNVPEELDAIVRANAKDGKGVYPGLELIDQQFSWSALRDNLDGKKILHIATHGAFVPNDPEASFLLLGTGKKLPISEINLLQNLGNVHLVVLSACETARGGRNQNGVEISGISSYFMGPSRAKAVMASLWLVNDKSTSQLMQQFYSNLANEKTPVTKAQALRQAQLSLLSGKDSSRGNTDERGGITAQPKPGKSPRNQGPISSFSHPYYWAPFILIGNGL